MLLDASAASYTIEHRRVAYDYQAVIGAIEGARHPAGGYITHHYQR